VSTAQRFIIDFSDLQQKRKFLSEMGQLNNLHEISIKRRVRHGTKEQRGYYFAVIVPAFVKACAEQGESVTEDEAHEAFKHLFLRHTKQLKNPVTGETQTVEFIESTEAIDIEEKSIYLEHCIGFLAQYFNVAVPPPEIWLGK
jgi:hypothetical protein